MELDRIEPAAARIDRAQPRRKLVGEPTELDRLGAAAPGAEASQRLAFGIDSRRRRSVAQGPVVEEKVPIDQRRRLIGRPLHSERRIVAHPPASPSL